MSSPRQPFSAPASLKVALRNNGLEQDADYIFFMWPALHTVALNFCRYVSPFIESQDGRSLIEVALEGAVTSFRMHEDSNIQRAIQAFIESLAKHVDDLCRVRLSVQASDGAWIIWQYDEPVLEWMIVHGRKAVQIRPREEPFQRGPVLVKLLSYICSVRDLQVAHLDLRHLI